MSRLTGLLIVVGLLIGSMAFAPGDALAREMVDATVIATDSDPTAGCTINVNVSWSVADLRGGNVTVMLYRSVNGGEFATAGMHARTDNDGLDTFPGGLVAPGESYTYRVEITKGPKHLVAVGESASASCETTV